MGGGGGRTLDRKVFPFLGSLFFFLFGANLVGVVPGGGIYGFGKPGGGFLFLEGGGHAATQTRQCGSEYDPGNGAPFYGPVASLDNSGSRGDRLPQRTVCSQGRHIRSSSDCTFSYLFLRGDQLAYFDLHSPPSPLFSA